MWAFPKYAEGCRRSKVAEGEKEGQGQAKREVEGRRDPRRGGGCLGGVSGRPLEGCMQMMLATLTNSIVVLWLYAIRVWLFYRHCGIKINALLLVEVVWLKTYCLSVDIYLYTYLYIYICIMS